MDKNDIPASLRLVGGQLLEARRSALVEKEGTPHSLEPVAKVNEVWFINDSRSTFLDATLDSLSRMEGRVIWIVGDLAGELVERSIHELLVEKVSAVVVFGGRGNSENELLPTAVPLYRAEELRTAVFLAKELAEAGACVLFSPACPSGNGFANYEERGAEFKRAVRDL